MKFDDFNPFALPPNNSQYAAGRISAGQARAGPTKPPHTKVQWHCTKGRWRFAMRRR